eukprot:scaffold116384_cov28-Tisochrysis_lutea.AAC.1
MDSALYILPGCQCPVVRNMVIEQYDIATFKNEFESGEQRRLWFRTCAYRCWQRRPSGPA